MKSKRILLTVFVVLAVLAAALWLAWRSGRQELPGRPDDAIREEDLDIQTQNPQPAGLNLTPD